VQDVRVRQPGTVFTSTDTVISQDGRVLLVVRGDRHSQNPSSDTLDERAGLGTQTQAAEPMTGGVICQAAVEAGANVGNAEHIDQECRQLVGPAGERFCPVGVIGVVGEEVRSLMDHHVAA
jgi:hypothetical protein